MIDFTFNDDIPALLTACGGVPVVIDGQDPPGLAVVDYVDEAQAVDAGIGGITGQVVTALVQTTAYPDVKASNDAAKASSIVIGSWDRSVTPPVFVAGATYRIRRRFKEGDGGVTRLWCANR